ncbi:GAF domain-like protein [Blastocladiella britannica]|nr:GAF domain-like protein [Blastocladiella britannica]
MKDLPTLSSTKVPTKPELYAHLSLQLSSLIDGQRSWVTNLSNASALIYHALRDRQSALGSPTPTINWVGFYLRSEFLGASITTGKGKLLLAPFQGRIACTEIPFGKGVCGAAAREGTVQLVPDVHAFPGHIACDSATNSEVVVPLLSSDGTVLGVFDLDCEEHNGFDADDVAGLTAIAKLLVDGCDWPSCST